MPQNQSKHIVLHKPCENHCVFEHFSRRAIQKIDLQTLGFGALWFIFFFRPGSPAHLATSRIVCVCVPPSWTTTRSLILVPPSKGKMQQRMQTKSQNRNKHMQKESIITNGKQHACLHCCSFGCACFVVVLYFLHVVASCLCHA